nr:hypothetical protein [Tanacetum cinerariifolium]
MRLTHIENAKTSYMERCRNKNFQYVHAWNILKNYTKWDMAEPIDEDNLAELFALIRERVSPANLDSRKCEAAEAAYVAKRKKELEMLELRELEFLMIDPCSLPPEKRVIIEKKQAEIMRRYPNA